MNVRIACAAAVFMTAIGVACGSGDSSSAKPGTDSGTTVGDGAGSGAGSGDNGAGPMDGGSSGTSSGVPSDDATTGSGGPDGAADSGAAAGDDGAEVPPPPALTWKAEGPQGVWRGLWASGPNDIYAVGSSGMIAHSTGNDQWAIQSSGTGAILYGVWGSGPTDVYIAPYINTVLHSTGDGGWDHEPQPAASTFYGVWGSGPNDIYVYGGGATHSTGGGVWQMPAQNITANADQGIPVYWMWGSSSTDVYASGPGASVYHSKGDGSWTRAFTPSGLGPIGISGSGPTDVYVATQAIVYHWSGSGSWAPQMVPLGDNEVMNCIWVLSKNAIYAGTTRGHILRSGGDGRWVADSIDPSATSGLVGAIWGTSPKNLYVGMSPSIYHGTAP
jgi:hypothetical protein